MKRPKPLIYCHDSEGQHQASVRDWPLAGAMMAILGGGATVRFGSHAKADIVYTEGKDGDSSESYDAVFEHVSEQWYGEAVCTE